MYECGNNCKFLFHTVRIAVNCLSKCIFNFKHFSIFTDSCLTVRLADSENIGNKIEVLNTCHKLIQIGIVGNVSNFALTFERFFFYRHTVNIDFALVKVENSTAGFDCCCLSCTVVSDKAVNLAFLNMK